MNPTGIFYFAYGSNMNPDRIRARIPEARAVGPAMVKGWRVAERLYADIERDPDGTVEGVLYLVTPTEHRRLDLFEGYPTIYKTIGVDAWLEPQRGDKPFYRVPAFTYVMTDETRKERDGKPYPADYRIICAVGAEHWGIKSAFGLVGAAARRRKNQNTHLLFPNYYGIIHSGKCKEKTT